jgi:hypothetical protein
MNDMRITGGCLCGEVQFELTESPIDGGYCHCEQCRRTGGGLFGANLKFNKSSFKFITGKPKYLVLRLARRGFGKNCGSPLLFMFDENKVWVPIGSLDRPSDWPFDKEGWCGHWYVEEKVDWYKICDDLPQHRQSTESHDEI